MRVLAAIDGSSHSHGVVDAIANRVWEAGTEIKLITVIEKHADHIHSRGGYHRIEHNQAMADPSIPHQKLTHFSMSLRDKLQSQSNISIDPVIAVGHAKEEILALTRDWRADLIVVGTHGRSGLEQLILGSVSKEVMHHAMSNVHVVRADLKSANKDVYRILLPVDHSPFSAAAVEWLVRHRWRKPVEIRIMTVIPEINQLSEKFTEETNPEHAATILSQIQALKAGPLAELNSLAQEIQTKIEAIAVSCCVSSGDPAAVITETADDWQCDLILMGSHGRTGLSRLLMGSVSSAVAQTSRTSIEVVKPPAVHEWYSRHHHR